MSHGCFLICSTVAVRRCAKCGGAGPESRELGASPAVYQR
ncbi:hypothetical protein FM104_05120 [Microbacterium esteraromaticum]|uniref:Uncharacterized protein n=1 Tax=Microbacterium esteraromaticum TaxID=57043 RepID=A0A1R4J227_9MICO|nr:hypothetical protein FM104_05120 [Microbacterium esteraromaticum]